MMFENKGYWLTMIHPFWKKLASEGLLLNNFHAVAHPSQPNYVAQIAGSFFNVIDDNVYDIEAHNLVDTLEARGVSWKTYQEDYTPLPDGGCDPAKEQNKLYYRKHNPFMVMNNIRNNITRCRRIVPATQLDKDLASPDPLPQFMYYTPNINNDAHDRDLDFAGKFLDGFLKKYLPNPKFSGNTLFMITFDEDEYLENNHIYTVLLGPYVKPNSTNNDHFTHYSLLKTLQENWKLDSLGRNDTAAASFLHTF